VPPCREPVAIPWAEAPIEARLAAAGLPPLPRTAWLEVDLGALTANLALLRQLLPPGVRVEPAVKADAYGHGAVPVARALEAAGADGLCVATLDEALELRAGGVRLPILVLYPVPPELAPLAAHHEIALTVGDRTLLERLLAVVRRRRGGEGPALRLQLEVETGLGRGGLREEDLPAALAAIGGTPGVQLVAVWSHLAAPEDLARSREQEERLGRVVGLLVEAGLPVVARHLAASGGLVAGTAPPLDVVRPGLVLYGIVPDGVPPTGPWRQAVRDLAPVLSLHARPVRVEELPAGSGISYGPTFVTTRPSRIATLPLGYADGWWRQLSNRASALVRGRRVPLVGTVAMDAVMADVTDVPGPPVTVDDEFVLLGTQGGARIRVEELARACTTISWEILASLARRLPRVYTAGAGVPVGMRTLIEWRDVWPRSTSGTVTSVSWKSRPSSSQP
jgi:alanine racemase